MSALKLSNNPSYLINRLSKKIGKDVISNSFGMGYGIHNQIRKETQKAKKPKN